MCCGFQYKLNTFLFKKKKDQLCLFSVSNVSFSEGVDLHTQSVKDE